MPLFRVGSLCDTQETCTNMYADEYARLQVDEKIYPSVYIPYVQGKSLKKKLLGINGLHVVSGWTPALVGHVT